MDLEEKVALLDLLAALDHLGPRAAEVDLDLVEHLDLRDNLVHLDRLDPVDLLEALASLVL